MVDMHETMMQTQIVHIEDAYGLMDSAVAAAMRNSKPVYISICCNMAGEVHPSFGGKPSCASAKSCFMLNAHSCCCMAGSEFVHVMAQTLSDSHVSWVM